jgi:hypothetical protein
VGQQKIVSTAQLLLIGWGVQKGVGQQPIYSPFIHACHQTYSSSIFTVEISVADPDPGYPGSGMGESQHPDPGLTIRIIFFRCLKPFFCFFGLKYLNSVMRIRDPGWRQFGSGIRDGKKLDPGSGINIPDPGSSTLVAFVRTRCDPVLRIWIRCLLDPVIRDP